jgi:hypothetical protein
MTMMNNSSLPWYAALLGHPPDGEQFGQLISQFELSSDEDPEASPRWYENKSGISVAIRGGTVHAIQLFSSENPGFTGFSEPLPLGLSFAMTRDEIHARLGDPVDVLPPHDGTIPHGGIDRYDAETCTVMVAYSPSSGRLAVLGFERPRT